MKKLIPALLLTLITSVYATDETELNLHNAGLTSVNHLSHMTHLNSLDLSANPGLTSIQGILSLTNLTRLVLRGTRVVTDLPDIATFKHLRVLDLAGVFDRDRVRYPSLDFLTSLVSLQALDLSQNDHVYRISPLVHLTNLTRLCLWANPNIHDLESTQQMKSLILLEKDWEDS